MTRPPAADRRAALARLARAQDGLWTTKQARALGLDRDTPRRWVQAGLARRWNDRVLSDAGLPDTWERRVRAAQLAVSGSVVVGATAARLHELSFGGRQVELAVPRSTRHRPPGVVVHRPRRLPPTTRVRGLVVSTVAATILHVAAQLDRHHLEDVVADALRRRLATADTVRTMLDAQVALPGRRELAAALDLLDPVSTGDASARGPRRPGTRRQAPPTGRRSPLERGFADLLARHGFPEPAWGHTMEIDGRRYELDAWWEEPAVAVELDGHRFHATPTELRQDSHRQNALLLGGVSLVLRFTHDDVFHHPADVARTVAAGLRA